MPRLGVIGSMVWDEIHGRDPFAAPVEEWGGIAYALAALDAALPDDWEIVPLIKVGRDLAPQAAGFLSSLRHVAGTARFVEVPAATQRVTLRYQSSARRCEEMSGGVPGWSWPELGPMVASLDALYINFISGAEMTSGTAEALRRGFSGPIYADLHSLFLTNGEGAARQLRALPGGMTWFSCFDVVQCNDDELAQLGNDPLVIAAEALAAGVSLLAVTIGERGVAYFAQPRFTGWGTPPAVDAEAPLAVRTARLAAPAVEALDPTGCGDVFGGTCCARLLAGDELLVALGAANAAAARNATFRGAGQLAPYLRGELVLR